MPFKKFALNLEKSPVDDRDYVAETIYAAAEDLPATVDLRKDLPPIRNQGSQGTCSAQTSACMKEWQERQDINFRGHMSPQFIYNNRTNQDTSGMFPRDSMKILKNIGSVKEEAYPYNTFKDFGPALMEEAGDFKIQGYATVNTIEGCMTALLKNGPCYLSVPVYNYGRRMWKPKQGDKRIGGHAMTIVGYNDAGFIIRNSWGTSWADDGYAIFPYIDWGMHWEVWTAIDAESGDPLPDPESDDDNDKSSTGLFTSIWNWIKGLFS